MVDSDTGRTQGRPADGRRPNILLVVSDQERQRSWLPPSVSLPWRERLMTEGLEFTSYFTHSSPCSPSRASLLTGRYLPGHGVTDNVIMPEHAELDPAVPTVGSLLRAGGYRSSYIGKWHLSHAVHPDMEAYGFSDWDGNDRHFMGWAGTGVHFDPVIASNAAHWLRAHAGRSAAPSAEPTQPWFLTVALVNPHDVMWFPVDQPGYRERHPEEVAGIRRILESAAWKDDDALPIYDEPYDEVFEDLPANFSDDLHAKPEAHRQWRWDQQHGLWGYIDPDDTKAWLRHLDYYVELHRQADRSLGTVLQALLDSGAWDDTVVIFTSDHGDMCGSHGLRSKGPFVYDEIMRVPLYIRAPGVTSPGAVTDSLASHVDLASTICSLAGVDPARVADEPTTLQGVDLAPVLREPTASVRDHILFAQDSAQTQNLNGVRYALRGFFDGTTKYARYYGVGGGKPSTGLWGKSPGHKLFDVDCAFDDQDHEWYDHDSDPLELVNMANDRGRRQDLRRQFERLLAYEDEEMERL